jgi:hypothetical protein
MYVCIMRQCFGVGTSYGSWLGLTIGLGYKMGDKNNSKGE